MANISNISSTRSTLHLKKQQIEIVLQGIRLLDKKRLALMQLVVELEDEVVEAAEQLQLTSNEAHKTLALAIANGDKVAVTSAAIMSKLEPELSLTTKNIMGVKVNQLHWEKPPQEKENIPRAPFQTPSVRNTAKAFMNEIEDIVHLADGELQLCNLVTEIRSTTRRMNALDHIILPKLKDEQKYIRNALEERERAENFRLRLAKKNIAKRNKNGS